MASMQGAADVGSQHSAISRLVPRAAIFLCLSAASVSGAGHDIVPTREYGSNKTLTSRLINVPNAAAVLFPFQKPPAAAPRPETTTVMVTRSTSLADAITEATTSTIEGPAAAVATPAVGGAGAAMAANSDTLKPTPQAVLAEGMMEKPPQKAVLGGIPTPELDVPITIMFLILFALGAFLHLTTYRANSKRGHKFRLSSLMVDFCMVRIVTCVFRIAWAFSGLQGVVLSANLFQNGGAVVIFAVNLFFGQRLVRAMHPSIGWHPIFSRYSLFLIWTCPAVTSMNVIAASIASFSAGKPAQFHTAETVLKVGASWNMMLSVTPLLWVFLASAKPGPEPENFGQGDLRVKAALLVFSAGTMAVGAAVRLTISVNEEPPESLLGKDTLFTTQFMLEYLTVVAYAYFRIDLLFHIPNGSSRPGDYSSNSKEAGFNPRLLTSDDIEREIGKFGARYEILKSSSGDQQGPVMALIYPSSEGEAVDGAAPPRYPKFLPDEVANKALPPIRPPRATRTTFYMTKDLSPIDLSPSSPKMFV